jgi:hypothetical protein
VPSTSTATSNSTSPSTAPSFAFEVLLAQSQLTYLQEAILVEDTPEAQAFEWLENDPGVSTCTNVEVLQRFTLATLYYATGGENWIDDTGWLDYNTAECDWSTTGDSTDYWLLY